MSAIQQVALFDVRWFGADGAGGATDLAALDRLLEAQAADPALRWNGVIDASRWIASSSADFFPYLQRAFGSGLYEGAHIRFDSARTWVSTVRPSTGLGPQGQYLQPPMGCTLEWDPNNGWDCSAWGVASSPTVIRREGSYGTAVELTTAIVAGRAATVSAGAFVVGVDYAIKSLGTTDFTLLGAASNAIGQRFIATGAGTGGVGVGTAVATPTYGVTAGQGSQFAHGDRLILRARAGLDSLTVGAKTLIDAAPDAITASLSGTTLTVTVAAATNSIVLGGEITGAGVTSCLVTAFLTGTGGTGTYTVSVPQTVASQAMKANSGWNAYAEDVYIESSTADTITLSAPTLFSYPLTTSAVVQSYVNEPSIKLINPTAKGPGSASGDRFFMVTHARSFVSEGGQLDNWGARSVRVLSPAHCEITGLHGVGPANPSSDCNLIAIYDAARNARVRDCVAYGFYQAFVSSGSAYTYGISDGTIWENCVSFDAAANGFSQHSLEQNTTYRNCWAYYSIGSGFDIRTKSIFYGGGSRGCGLSAIIMRNAINGSRFYDFFGKDCLSGIELQDSANPPYEQTPGDLIGLNCNFENIGGSGSKGMLALVYSQEDGTALGRVRFDVQGTMNNNTAAIQVGGGWETPKINYVLGPAPGTSPAGAAVAVSAGATGGAGQGPNNPIIRGVASSTYAIPTFANTTATGVIISDHVTEGLTTSRVVSLTNAGNGTAANKLSVTTESDVRNPRVFNNVGATALVKVILPSASGVTGTRLKFIVADADGFEISALPVADGGNDTIQISSGAPGSVAGWIKSTTRGAWVELFGLSSTEWEATVNSAADWTLGGP